MITVTATDASGNKASATRTVTQTDADITPPTVYITGPSTKGSYTTTKQILSIRGTASDIIGVAAVTWVNDRGGSGTFTGTTAWIGLVNIQPGVNVITVTATDAAGNKASSTLTVTYPDTAPPTVNITSPTSSGLYTTNTQAWLYVELLRIMSV